jgi:hypothetical protein
VNEVVLAAAEIQAVCEEHGWRFCFIGAQLRPLAELKGAPEILDQLESRRLEFEQ